MDSKGKTYVTVEVTVNAPVEKVWQYWTSPEHIIKWNNASDDWHTPYSENDLRVGGKFLSRMEAKDGSSAFDFTGTYDDVLINELIAYKIADGRQVKIIFTPSGKGCKVSETFETESIHSEELQRNGWQAILNNFKEYVETN